MPQMLEMISSIFSTEKYINYTVSAKTVRTTHALSAQILEQNINFFLETHMRGKRDNDVTTFDMRIVYTIREKLKIAEISCFWETSKKFYFYLEYEAYRLIFGRDTFY